MRTLFLMPATWDLTLDAAGNLAIASDQYARAQSVANKCRVFLSDMYYSQDDGIPYLEQILGKNRYSLAMYRKYLEDAAMSVDGVISANAELSTANDRIVKGRIIFIDVDGRKGVIEL
ncbi:MULTISPECIES: hypothetical protein [Photorhabdus]|uniref:Uncharacterized protein n=2 Tax=Photorhabdus TaxID=29487 RepID=A0A7X5QHG1_9GAMM|nr:MULTISPECIES: hypothetical protein [Photorhabdus]KER03409.1 hypothetical protein MEG1DRAFT_01884 [Photorhabdus temperata subsp. temperata Meg1]NHB94407.1 hypothetical protein [Photorhabdus cinerea]